jgi:peptide/nickel transport system permease protein
MASLRMRPPSIVCRRCGCRSRRVRCNVNVVRYLAIRVLQLIPVFVGITVISFALIHLIPGDPARTLLGPKVPESAILAFRAAHGLDKPLPQQYWSFLGHLVRGNLGTSLYYGEHNTSLIWQRLPVTLYLLLLSSIFAVIASVPLAVLAAAKSTKPADSGVRLLTVLGLGIPSFWLGILLLIVFAVKIPILPVGGYGDGIFGHFESLLLPALTIAVGLAPLLIRSLRSELIKALGADYVLTARAKGLSPRRVLFRHALRNSIGPTATVLVINVGALIGGTVVIESVFSLPGVGALLIQSIDNRDFSTVQALTLVFAALVVALNIANDLFQSLQDRRVVLGA